LWRWVTSPDVPGERRRPGSRHRLREVDLVSGGAAPGLVAGHQSTWSSTHI
jgi:hypothetical protein